MEKFKKTKAGNNLLGQRKILLPKFLRLEQKPAALYLSNKLPEQNKLQVLRDRFFVLQRAIVFAVRLVLSFVTGGTECVVCGAACFVVPVCQKCEHFFSASGFSHDEEKRCSVCGKRLVSEHGVCLKCRTEKCFSHIDFVFPLYSYRLWNKNLAFLWKKKGVRALADFFALRLLRALQLLGQKVVVPVPPRQGKIFSVGWDQIEDVCVLLEKQGILVLRVLERVSELEQKKLDRDGRLSAISSAYKMKEGRNLDKVLRKSGGQMPAQVCLLDDVLTTGATVESCAIALRKNGVKKITALSIFMVE